ncbi:MAG: Rrf2 family transcriptional regulator [Chlamydiota bacterium]|nr:Rrf2 family transcriptional regulator [Chlamydiota bacterium]
MRYTTKTEYGVVCLIYMTCNYPKQVTIKDMANSEQYSVTYIEKILQSLRSAGIVQSHQGIHGGYTLSRPPSQINLKEIIEALEGSTYDAFCEQDNRGKIVCTHVNGCGARPVWKRTKEILDLFFSSISLETVSKAEKDVINNLIQIHL